MTYWQMNGKIASVNEAISPNVNRRFTYGIVFPSNGTLQFVALCRINRPERCEHGHAIAASELLVEVSPFESHQAAPRKFCLQHAPIPHVKLLAFKPKGRR